MNLKKIEQGVRLILEGIGEDLNRQGIRRTPQRVAKMCKEIFAGIGSEARIGSSFEEQLGENSVIVIDDIPFYSMCEHHLLPFFGTMQIVYAPQGNRVAGFSGFSRIVDTFARRLQIQERLTEQVADAVMKTLDPAGVMVTAEAIQLCAAMRGEHKKDIRAITRTVRGVLPAHLPLTRYSSYKNV